MILDIIKLVLSFGLGSLIGFEREKYNKPVGIRTISLICVGSTFITILITNYFPDETPRIIGSIITGLGFLGAGTIIAHGEKVKGLTTAALTWVMALIGVGIGIGEYTLSIITSVLIFLILMIRKVQMRKEKPKKVKKNKKKLK